MVGVMWGWLSDRWLKNRSRWFLNILVDLDQCVNGFKLDSLDGCGFTVALVLWTLILAIFNSSWFLELCLPFYGFNGANMFLFASLLSGIILWCNGYIIDKWFYDIFMLKANHGSSVIFKQGLRWCITLFLLYSLIDGVYCIFDVMSNRDSSTDKKYKQLDILGNSFKALIKLSFIQYVYYITGVVARRAFYPKFLKEAYWDTWGMSTTTSAFVNQTLTGLSNLSLTGAFFILSLSYGIFLITAKFCNWWSSIDNNMIPLIFFSHIYGMMLLLALIYYKQHHIGVLDTSTSLFSWIILTGSILDNIKQTIKKNEFNQVERHHCNRNYVQMLHEAELIDMIGDQYKDVIWPVAVVLTMIGLAYMSSIELN